MRPSMYGRHVLPTTLLLAFACSDDATMDMDTKKCVPSDCSSYGKNCGPFLDETMQCLQCGVCSAPETCGGGGEPNVCGCSAKTECVLGDCGSAPDGCGGTLECGDTCVAPLSCGGGGAANRCGETVAPGEECNGDTIGCEAGYACCPSFGGHLKCLTEFELGGCAPELPDLALDQEMLRSSIRTHNENYSGNPPCVRNGECEFDPKPVRVIQFQTAMVNQSTTDFPLPSTETNNALYEPGELGCTGPRARFLHYRLRKDAQSAPIVQGSLMTKCLQDTERVDPEANVSAKYVCYSNMGLQGGWRYVFEQKLNHDCESIDISGIMAGEYILELEVNAKHAVMESDFSNNVITATISF